VENIQGRYDLLDCGIGIYSPDVLALFEDNFDWNDLRQDFFQGVISNFEVLGSKIFAQVITDEYAVRVRNLRTYHAVSKDVMRRWTYPMAPDRNFVGNTTYLHFRQFVYKEKNVTLSRDCTIGNETVAGEGTSIGAWTSVAGSVIGRRC